MNFDLPVLVLELVPPISICDPDESTAGWPFRKHVEPTLAERLLGRPVYRETRRADMREMMRADRAGADDGCE